MGSGSGGLGALINSVCCARGCTRDKPRSAAGRLKSKNEQGKHKGDKEESQEGLDHTTLSIAGSSDQGEASCKNRFRPGFLQSRLVNHLCCYELAKKQVEFRGQTVNNGWKEAEHVGKVVRKNSRGHLELFICELGKLECKEQS